MRKRIEYYDNCVAKLITTKHTISSALTLTFSSQNIYATANEVRMQQSCKESDRL